MSSGSLVLVDTAREPVNIGEGGRIGRQDGRVHTMPMMRHSQPWEQFPTLPYRPAATNKLASAGRDTKPLRKRPEQWKPERNPTDFTTPVISEHREANCTAYTSMATTIARGAMPQREQHCQVSTRAPLGSRQSAGEFVPRV